MTQVKVLLPAVSFNWLTQEMIFVRFFPFPLPPFFLPPSPSSPFPVPPFLLSKTLVRYVRLFCLNITEKYLCAPEIQQRINHTLVEEAYKNIKKWATTPNKFTDKMLWDASIQSD